MLFESSDIYISQVYDGEMKRIVLKDQYGPISVYLLPFLKPAAVRHALQRDDINTYEEGVMAALQECEIDTTQRNVLVAHQFVTGADRSDSEETWVGGLDNVSAEVFKDFDYVALGHIHIGSSQLTHIPSGNQGYCTDPHISLLQKLHNRYRLFMICFRKRILKRRPTVTQGLSPHFLRSVDVSQCHIVKILKYFRTDIVNIFHSY